MCLSNYNNRLCDYHLHTSFSSDSDNPPENVVRQAVKLGLKSICFTDHNDFDYPPENGEVMFMLDFNVSHGMGCVRSSYRELRN